MPGDFSFQLSAFSFLDVVPDVSFSVFQLFSVSFHCHSFATHSNRTAAPVLSMNEADTCRKFVVPSFRTDALNELTALIEEIQTLSGTWKSQTWEVLTK